MNAKQRRLIKRRAVKIVDAAWEFHDEHNRRMAEVLKTIHNVLIEKYAGIAYEVEQ